MTYFRHQDFLAKSRSRMTTAITFSRQMTLVHAPALLLNSHPRTCSRLRIWRSLLWVWLKKSIKSDKHLNSLDSHPFRNCFVFAIMFFLSSSNGKGCLWMKVHSTEKYTIVNEQIIWTYIKYEEKRKHTWWEHTIKLRAVIRACFPPYLPRVGHLHAGYLKAAHWLVVSLRDLRNPRQTSL